MEAQATFFDVEAGPDLGDQLVLADHFVRAGQQHHENIVGAGAKLDAGAIPGQQSLAGNQEERAKRDRLSASRRRRCHGLLLR